MNDLSIVVLNYNTKNITLECINSILGQKWKHEIDLVIIDNASGDGSVKAIKSKHPKLRVIENIKNYGFS